MRNSNQTNTTVPGAACVVVSLLGGLLACLETNADPWARHVIDASSRGADGVRLADANGDGLLDIATGWEEGGVVRVYINPGPDAVREPWPAVTAGQAGAVEDAVLVDLDGDGALDVVSCSEGNVRQIWVHWAPQEPDRYMDAEAWRTEPIPAADTNTRWMYAVPMQVDGRHGVDLVAAGKGGDGAPLGWLEAPEDPRDLAAWQWHPLRTVRWLMSIEAADMNGDGRMDLVVSDRNQPGNPELAAPGKCGVFWLEHPGSGPELHEPWSEHPIGGFGEEVMFLTVGDFDGAGTPEILAAASGRRGSETPKLLYFWQSEGDEPEWEPFPIPLPEEAGTGKAVAAGDIDLDGKLDAVFTCENSHEDQRGVMWFPLDLEQPESMASGVEAHDISGPEGIKYDLVKLIDLDGDGDLDVLTCEEAFNGDGLGVIWYENPTRP